MSFQAHESYDGTWILTAPSSNGTLIVATGIDALQANVCAAILNGDEDLQFDNEGQAVIYTGYMLAPDQGDGSVMRYAPFEEGEGDHP